MEGSTEGITLTDLPRYLRVRALDRPRDDNFEIGETDAARVTST